MYQSRLPVLRLPANTAGEDYIVGDLHGQFDALHALLTRVNFRPEVDRLFSVGDLGDRGPKSELCFCLLDQPWFKAVAGNHDLALREYFQSLRPRELGEVHASVANDALRLLQRNGGDWALELRYMASKVLHLGRLALTQPHVIAVGEGEGRFNIVHAFLHAPYLNEFWTDELIDFADGIRGLRAMDLIDRFVDSRIPSRNLALAPDAPGWSLTYCGHSPVTELRRSLGHLMIDTGSGKSAKKSDCLLTMIRHSDQTVFQEVTARFDGAQSVA